jgi:hypothetical protein
LERIISKALEKDRNLRLQHGTCGLHATAPESVIELIDVLGMWAVKADERMSGSASFQRVRKSVKTSSCQCRDHDESTRTVLGSLTRSGGRKQKSVHHLLGRTLPRRF